MALGMGIKAHGFVAALDSFARLREGYGTDVKWIVGVGMEYGAYLEFGTSKMQPYPFFFPAARHVMRTQFKALEAKARTQPKPIPWLIQELALEIEAQAKSNIVGGGLSRARSPGVETKPAKSTKELAPHYRSGDLFRSIQAAPVSEFGPRGKFPSP